MYKPKKQEVTAGWRNLYWETAGNGMVLDFGSY